MSKLNYGVEKAIFSKVKPNLMMEEPEPENFAIDSKKHAKQFSMVLNNARKEAGFNLWE